MKLAAPATGAAAAAGIGCADRAPVLAAGTVVIVVVALTVVLVVEAGATTTLPVVVPLIVLAPTLVNPSNKMVPVTAPNPG